MVSLIKFSKILNFTFNFIISRGILFFFPLLFANKLSVKNFIILEQALGVANIIVPLVSLGLFSLLPKIINTNEFRFGYEFINLHIFFVIIIFLIISIFFNTNNIIYSSIIISSFLIVTQFFGNVEKIKKKRNRSIFLQTLLFLFLGFIIFVLNIKNIKNISHILVLVPFFFLIFNLLRINKINLTKYFSKENWLFFLKSSVPNLFSGFLLVIIFQLLKIITPYFFDDDQSYLLLYIFRFTFIGFFSYQILSFYFFRSC